MYKCSAVIPMRPQKNNVELRPMFAAAKDLFGKRPVTGVEVGTSTGANACEVVDAWPEIEKFYCVDYYPTYSDFMFQEDQDRAIRCATVNFALEPKIHLRIDKSVDAAKNFADGSLDFVYIDANHSYAFVKEDILAWLPKIKKGGIIGGHDYDWTDKDFNDELAVKRAVDEIFGDRVHYHLSLFTLDAESRVKVLHGMNEFREEYTGINSDWWVFL